MVEILQIRPPISTFAACNDYVALALRVLHPVALWMDQSSPQLVLILLRLVSGLLRLRTCTTLLRLSSFLPSRTFLNLIQRRGEWIKSFIAFKLGPLMHFLESSTLLRWHEPAIPDHCTRWWVLCVCNPAKIDTLAAQLSTLVEVLLLSILHAVFGVAFGHSFVKSFGQLGTTYIVLIDSISRQSEFSDWTIAFAVAIWHLLECIVLLALHPTHLFVGLGLLQFYLLN